MESIKPHYPRTEGAIVSFGKIAAFCFTRGACRLCPLEQICDKYLKDSNMLVFFAEECEDKLKDWDDMKPEEEKEGGDEE